MFSCSESPPRRGRDEYMFFPRQQSGVSSIYPGAIGAGARVAGDAAPLTAAEQDVCWMRRVAEGDVEAFQALIEAHQARVVGTVAKMLGDDVDSEDIAQQVFIRVWRSAARYQPTAKFTTWLFKITRNLVFNELRRRKRHPVTPLQHEEEEHFFQPVDCGGMPPDASLLDSELNDAVQMAIDALPETQRMAIVLRRYEEMPYEEIGEVLNLSVPAVKSVLFRARAELRVQLRKYLEA